MPDFIDFRTYLPTFPWQLQCFVQKIVRRKLSDSCELGPFIHSSAVARSTLSSTTVFLTTTKNLSNFLAAVPFVIVLRFLGLIPKLTSDVLDWITLWTSESKTVTLV